MIMIIIIIMLIIIIRIIIIIIIIIIVIIIIIIMIVIIMIIIKIIMLMKARKETCCRHMGYSFRLAAWVHLYVPSHRKDSTYHRVCYTSRGALAGKRNSSMGAP